MRAFEFSNFVCKSILPKNGSAPNVILMKLTKTHNIPFIEALHMNYILHHTKHDDKVAIKDVFGRKEQPKKVPKLWSRCSVRNKEPKKEHNYGKVRKPKGTKNISCTLIYIFDNTSFIFICLSVKIKMSSAMRILASSFSYSKIFLC